MRPGARLPVCDSGQNRQRATIRLRRLSASPTRAVLVVRLRVNDAPERPTLAGPPQPVRPRRWSSSPLQCKVVQLHGLGISAMDEDGVFTFVAMKGRAIARPWVGVTIQMPVSDHQVAMKGRAIARPWGEQPNRSHRRSLRCNEGPCNCTALGGHAPPTPKTGGHVAMKGRAIARPWADNGGNK